MTDIHRNDRGQRTVRVQTNAYWTQPADPYYIGTPNAIASLLSDVESTARIIAVPFNGWTVIEGNSPTDLDKLVIKAYSNNLGQFETFVGEEPDATGLPFLRLGPTMMPPSPPHRIAQCGACYRFVPNPDSYEIVHLDY